MPEPRPDENGEAGSAAEGGNGADGNTAAGSAETPATAPIPREPPPQDGKPGEPEGIGAAGQHEPDTPKIQQDPRSTAKPSLLMPREEIVCRQRLHDLGVAFEARPAETGGAGCSLPYPIAVGSLRVRI